MLLLSHFSHVRLCVTSQMAAHQAPRPWDSRQEYWSGLLFPSPMHESEVAQSCPTLSDPMDCSLPGSSVHGLFQARVLEWGAIAFSSFLTRADIFVVLHMPNNFVLYPFSIRVLAHLNKPVTKVSTSVLAGIQSS